MVTFYELDDSGTPTKPVLFLDTLKVSTMEQTTEEATASGGKGNAPLIIWDYGKEITITLEDALFSAKSLAIMFGNGSVASYSGNTAYIMKTEQFTAAAAVASSADLAAAGWANTFVGADGKQYTKYNAKFYGADGSVLGVSGTNTPVLAKGETYFCTYDVKADGQVIEINANTFPGTYYVTADTYARSAITGKDEYFQWIVPKAKIQSENSITLEAEGDPSVFNLNLRVLRPANGVMMQLVKYDLVDGTDASSSVSIIHNHYLKEKNLTT